MQRLVKAYQISFFIFRDSFNELSIEFNNLHFSYKQEQFDYNSKVNFLSELQNKVGCTFHSY